MDPVIEFHPAILKIADELHRAEQERLARLRPVDDPRRRSFHVGAMPHRLANLLHVHPAR
jgi:hypothetical protein